MAAALPEGTRKSDRWITPGVIIAAIITTGLAITGVALAVAYLSARGVDPDPMLKLVAQVGTGCGVLLNIVLVLAGRATSSKVERNTGVLAGTVADVAGTVADVADAVTAQSAAAPQAATSVGPQQLPPVPVATR
jgi:hypothetical protein